MNTLFVYGIFLGEDDRKAFGMSYPEYDTVEDYATYGIGASIVEARHKPGLGLELTGLIVDVNPAAWPALDRLEQGYDRIKITATSGIHAYMYVAKEVKS